jgi:uncharacterized protein YcbX
LPACVEKIFIHPIKSLERVAVDEAEILPGGSLKHDREFALFDAAGHFIIGKRTPLVHQVRCDYDLPGLRVNLRAPDRGESGYLHLIHDAQRLEAWLSAYFNMPVSLKRNTTVGFPDDTDSPGPTLIGAATLEKIKSWFGDIPDAAEASRRFRSNIEIGGVEEFWEDRLFGAPGETRPFSIGDVFFAGVNPCARCVVPSRNSSGNGVTKSFAKIFSHKRRESLPGWVESGRFDHFYRVAVNTRVSESEAGKTIREGDAVKLP